MRALLTSLMLVMASAAVADELPPNVPHRDIPMFLSADDIAIVRAAIDKLKEQGLDVNYGVVNHLSEQIGPTQLPMIGFALSRASADLRACALLQRLEPSAVCAK